MVVDTAVLLERDRDNFIHLLDLWAAQVATSARTLVLEKVPSEGS